MNAELEKLSLVHSERAIIIMIRDHNFSLMELQEVYVNLLEYFILINEVNLKVDFEPMKEI
jgi:hypothetical protein